MAEAMLIASFSQILEAAFAVRDVLSVCKRICDYFAMDNWHKGVLRSKTTWIKSRFRAGKGSCYMALASILVCGSICVYYGHC